MSRHTLYSKSTHVIQEIYHEVTIRAAREEVFLALTKAALIDEWGGGPARVQAKRNGVYSLWDGEMHGIIKEYNPPALLVHSLREASWDEGCLDSLVTYELEEVSRGTLLKLSHSGLPTRKIRELHNEGWCEYFLGPLKAYLERF